MIRLQVFCLLRNAFGHEVEHAAADIARRILLQARHDQILFVDYPAVVQRDLFAEDLQQRGLAGAVAPDQTHALVVFDMNFGVV